MRLRARIPLVDPGVMKPSAECPYEGCQGAFFKPHQRGCQKRVRDSQYQRVTVYRRRCLRCGRTHRVYPQGVSRADQTDRLKGLSIMLYLLGISYRGVGDALNALGFPLSHSTVYRNVQAGGEKVRELKQAALEERGREVKVVGGDLSYLKCKGEKVVIGVAIDAQEGVTLDIQLLDNEETETLKGWLMPLLDLVGAEVLTTDDQDGFKTVADEAGVGHQVCRRHVTLNLLDFVSKAAQQVMHRPPPVPRELSITSEQLLEDLQTLEWMMLGHPEHGPRLLEEMYDRYSHAPPPRKGTRATIWYRMRNRVLHLWNNWKRLTYYREFLHHQELKVDETNNSTERVIGWQVKERYRTMRGYKRPESILNVTSLIAWLQEQPPGNDMSLALAA